MALVIDETIEIDAPAEKVWEVLTDFEHYGEWNTFCVEAASTLVPGDPIDMRVRLGTNTRAQREWIRTHTPGTEFSYTMKPVALGALHSRRSHTVVALGPNRSRYESRFTLAGWLSPVVVLALGKHLRAGFGAMTAGVGERATAH
ncbi:SRPBCC domain-containing protein [Nocardia mangyaensis]|uniref:SRPBCC domain-containing protein n=1 Tax=Nocardia mangyaensis TaxID=2213200 RepID=UPI0026760146|nr:SRPBCC domain-containing protein [Nocardia mangyaensis]MDO3645900.1 SRPBCC domain-containing protein [Nocardia mangyaensis]